MVEGRTFRFAKYGLEHIAGAKEVRAQLQEANCGLHGLRIPGQNALKRSVVAAWEGQLIVTGVEYLTGTLPLQSLLGAAIPKSESLVDTRLKSCDLLGVRANY